MASFSHFVSLLLCELYSYCCSESTGEEWHSWCLTSVVWKAVRAKAAGSSSLSSTEEGSMAQFGVLRMSWKGTFWCLYIFLSWYTKCGCCFRQWLGFLFGPTVFHLPPNWNWPCPWSGSPCLGWGEPPVSPLNGLCFYGLFALTHMGSCGPLKGKNMIIDLCISQRASCRGDVCICPLTHSGLWLLLLFLIDYRIEHCKPTLGEGRAGEARHDAGQHALHALDWTFST